MKSRGGDQTFGFSSADLVRFERLVGKFLDHFELFATGMAEIFVQGHTAVTILAGRLYWQKAFRAGLEPGAEGRRRSKAHLGYFFFGAGFFGAGFLAGAAEKALSGRPLIDSLGSSMVTVSIYGSGVKEST